MQRREWQLVRSIMLTMLTMFTMLTMLIMLIIVMKWMKSAVGVSSRSLPTSLWHRSAFVSAFVLVLAPAFHLGRGVQGCVGTMTVGRDRMSVYGC